MPEAATATAAPTPTGESFHERAHREAIADYQAWAAKVTAGQPPGTQAPPLSEYEAAVKRNAASTWGWHNPQTDIVIHCLRQKQQLRRPTNHGGGAATLGAP